MDTFALATVHALVQAAGGTEELRRTTALPGAVGCLQAGSAVLTETLTVTWRRTGGVKEWTEKVYVRQSGKTLVEATFSLSNI